MGLFFVAVERELGWSRTLISGAFSLIRLENSILAPIEGYLADRIGPHHMVFVGFLIGGIGFLLLRGLSSDYNGCWNWRLSPCTDRSKLVVYNKKKSSLRDYHFCLRISIRFRTSYRLEFFLFWLEVDFNWNWATFIGSRVPSKQAT